MARYMLENHEYPILQNVRIIRNTKSGGLILHLEYVSSDLWTYVTDSRWLKTFRETLALLVLNKRDPYFVECLYAHVLQILGLFRMPFPEIYFRIRETIGRDVTQFIWCYLME